VQRVQDRLVDPETGAIFNLRSMPPPAEIEDRLERRDRDDEGSFRRRLEVFHEQSKEVLPFFAERTLRVDATEMPENVFSEVSNNLGTFCNPDATAGADEADDWSDDEPEDNAAQASLLVAPAADIGVAGKEVSVMVSVQIPDEAARAPVDVCCVVDVSGSMGTEAKYEDESGNQKSDGMTVLDIVRHSVKAVLKALKEGDRLALVAFDHQAKTVLDLTEMTADGQQIAMTALDDLRPGGQTNIWGGILAAMDALRTSTAKLQGERKKAIMLLTDGQPNITPPRGHLAELRDYKDSHPDFTFQINTFGFGYNLDSELLLELATEGNGTYAFIPDALIVGTVFVNSVANILSTMSQSSTLNLMAKNGADFAGPVSGNFPTLDESWGRAVSLGPLQFGQSRDVVVPLKIPSGGKPYMEVVLTYPVANGRTARVMVSAAELQGTEQARLAMHRGDVVSTGYQAISNACKNNGKQAGTDVADLCKRLTSDSMSSTAATGLDSVAGRFKALSADTTGRITKALNGKERFNRWGKHYLRAVIRAHQLQLCTNFMDAGLQAYGGSLFQQLRSEGDKIFISLPAPAKTKSGGTGTRTTTATTTATSSARARSPSPNMNTYYAGSGGG